MRKVLLIYGDNLLFYCVTWTVNNLLRCEIFMLKIHKTSRSIDAGQAEF